MQTSLTCVASQFSNDQTIPTRFAIRQNRNKHPAKLFSRKHKHKFNSKWIHCHINYSNIIIFFSEKTQRKKWELSQVGLHNKSSPLDKISRTPEKTQRKKWELSQVGLHNKSSPLDKISRTPSWDISSSTSFSSATIFTRFCYSLKYCIGSALS